MWMGGVRAAAGRSSRRGRPACALVLWECKRTWDGGLHVSDALPRSRRPPQNGTAAGRFCAPFSLLGDICSDDMPSMRGCEGWQGLCGAPGTAVRQCAAQAPIRHVLLSDEAEKVGREKGR